MNDVMCPWCEADLVLEVAEEQDGQTCPECLTAWSYVDEPEFELAAGRLGLSTSEPPRPRRSRR